VLLLIAGEAAAIEGRPVGGVADDGTVAAGDFSEVIPVASFSVERDITVFEIEVEIAVVVEVAKLCAKAPAAKFDAEVARQVVVLPWIRTPSSEILET